LVLAATQIVLSLISLVCCIIVIVQIFSHGESTRGLIYVLTLFCGVGGLLTLIYGIQKQKEWNLYKVMTVWGVCILANVLIAAVTIIAGPPTP
jgi:hypothetical protein